jgi:hypothetical protein
MDILIDNKKEYIDHLNDLISIPICKRFLLFKKKSQNLKDFQSKLESIQTWTSLDLEKEIDLLMKKIKVDYLYKLIKEIITISIKIKIFDHKDKIKSLRIKMPSFEHFIHKCYLYSASYFWKNVYLFYDNLKPLEIQHNMNIIEQAVTKSILQAIRSSIPLDSIIKQINTSDTFDSNYQNKNHDDKKENDYGDDDNDEDDEEEDEEEEDDEEEDDEEENDEENDEENNDEENDEEENNDEENDEEEDEENNDEENNDEENDEEEEDNDDDDENEEEEDDEENEKEDEDNDDDENEEEEDDEEDDDDGQEEVVEKQDEVVEQQKEVLEKQDEVVEQQKEVVEKQEEVVEKQEEVVEQQKEVVEKQEEVVEQQKEVVEKQEEVVENKDDKEEIINLEEINNNDIISENKIENIFEIKPEIKDENIKEVIINNAFF